jgi:Tol biopolymer transport system component
MGETTGVGALLTALSPDGKYLFFTSRSEGRKDVFWVDAKFIEELRQQE